MNEATFIKMSIKSWHFKLNKYVYGDKIINSGMNNLCPYFWLLIGAFFWVPFMAPIDFIFVKPIKTLIKKNKAKSEMKIEKWLRNLSFEYASIIWDNYGLFTAIGIFSLPKFLKIKSGFDYFLRYKDIHSFTDKEWAKIREDYSEIKSKKYLSIQKEIDNHKKKKNADFDKKIMINKKIDIFLNIIPNMFKNLFQKIKNIFTFNSVSKIVKTTKKVVGLLITSCIAFVLYFIVNFFTFIVLYIIENWGQFLDGLITSGIILGTGSVTFIFCYFLIELIEKIKRYRMLGKKSFFFDIIYFIFVQIIWSIINYLIILPIKFIFYSIIWKTICIAIIKNSLISFWDGLCSINSIFGEYFGRTKGDYCPGIEWSDEK